MVVISLTKLARISLGTLLLFAQSIFAETLDSAKVTKVIKDVSLIQTGNGQSRPALLSDLVSKNHQVLTKTQSMAELQFNDRSILRLGQNTIFSFQAGTREISLKEGSILFNVPKGLGQTEIKTPSVTCAILGTTVLIQSFKNYQAYYVYEGEMMVGKKVLHPGELFRNSNGHEETIHFDRVLALKTGKLFTSFPPLPSLPLIEKDVEKDKDKGGGGSTNPPNGEKDAVLTDNRHFIQGQSPIAPRPPVS
jgi:hypothetical protein